MRHGRGTFLTFGKGFFDFTYFGALKIANLGGELFQRAGNYGQCRHVMGVTISLQNLGGYRGGFQSGLLGSSYLPLGIVCSYVLSRFSDRKGLVDHLSNLGLGV